MNKHLTLYELNQYVGETIQDAFPSAVWVEAEILTLREVKGHCYLELVQKDVFSTTPIARAAAKSWKSSWMQVSTKFVRATGGLPSVGMKVLVLVQPELHPSYGYSLIITDIDPAYTLGEVLLKRQEIIATLKAEGVYDMQRELTLPLVCQRVAVISSETAAGYGDFCQQLSGNSHSLLFHHTLFPAVMQGENIEQSVIAALNSIAEHLDDYDVVVIIRGGGSTSDMSGFDSLSLAENIANFPLPIITGIGHDRDECVADLVAYAKLKTPTAVASFLVERLLQFITRIQNAEQKIRTYANTVIDSQDARLSSLSVRVASYAMLYTEQRKSLLSQYIQRLINAQCAFLRTQSHSLDILQQRLIAADPKVLLERGYSITLHEGRVVTDASTLSEGATLVTRFANGEIESVVVKK